MTPESHAELSRAVWLLDKDISDIHDRIDDLTNETDKWRATLEKKTRERDGIAADLLDVAVG